MFWGCFWGGHRGPLVPLLEGSINRFVYIDLLTETFPRYSSKLQMVWVTLSLCKTILVFIRLMTLSSHISKNNTLLSVRSVHLTHLTPER